MKPMVAGMNEFFSLKFLHLGTLYLQTDGNSLNSLNRGVTKNRTDQWRLRSEINNPFLIVFNTLIFKKESSHQSIKSVNTWP